MLIDYQIAHVPPSEDPARTVSSLSELLTDWHAGPLTRTFRVGSSSRYATETLSAALAGRPESSGLVVAPPKPRWRTTDGQRARQESNLRPTA